MAEQLGVTSANRTSVTVRRSRPVCVRLGLLLLLIGVFPSHVPGVQTRPIDFVCNNRARRDRVNLRDLQEAMDRCNGSDILPSPVQLPCVSIQKTLWERKSVQQKCAEVVGALRVLQDGLGGVKSRSTLLCQTSLMERLEHHLRNNLLIVRQLHIQEEPTAASESTVPPDCPGQPSWSLRELLLRYRDLLRGKLDRLAIDLQHGSCPGHSR